MPAKPLNHRPFRRRNRPVMAGGFTLIELIITMLLIGILFITLPNFIANWLEASSIGQARNDLLSNAETALDTINTDIRLSGAADDTNRWGDSNAPGAPSNPYSWQSNGSTLVLARAAVDTSNNVIFSDPENYISQKDNEVYFLSGTTLYRRTIASDSSTDAAHTTCPLAVATTSCPADTVVATHVTSFSVQYYDANENQVTPSSARSIQLSITMKKVQNNHALTASYDTRMVFRNE